MLQELYILPILLFSVVVHELSHGWMALRLGDTTARDMGRLTMNPVPHIDPVGSVIVPLMSLAMSGRVFIAWAKPVPVNPANFSNPKRDDILVALVGPFSNLALALFSTIMFIVIAKLSRLAGEGSAAADEVFRFLLRMFHGGIILNIILGLFNLIPVPPLDGSHVVASLLPRSAGEPYRRIGFFGIFILILVMQYGPFLDVFYRLVDAMMYPFDYLINAAI
ncbi:MAG TPA: site-2 protease family protein [Bacteroidota bacterium]|nr:site-2 protease family protein [Bacteroidota bacterium]